MNTSRLWTKISLNQGHRRAFCSLKAGKRICRTMFLPSVSGVTEPLICAAEWRQNARSICVCRFPGDATLEPAIEGFLQGYAEGGQTAEVIYLAEDGTGFNSPKGILADERPVVECICLSACRRVE